MLKDAVLYRHHEDANGYSHLQLIVPKVSRDDVLHTKCTMRHREGTSGEAKTLSRLHTAPQHLVCRVVQSLRINHMQTLHNSAY